VLARRPQLSAQMVAGIVTPKITRAETPEARNLAELEARPACWKRMGAYWGEA
jgi:hypothetical protein